MKGEAPARVWQEDPEPLRGIIVSYAGQPEPESPVGRAARARERVAAGGAGRTAAGRRPAARLMLRRRPVARLMLRRRPAARLMLRRRPAARLMLRRRPAARLMLRRAVRLLPLRGMGKRSFQQAMDVCRAAARQLGGSSSRTRSS